MLKTQVQPEEGAANERRERTNTNDEEDEANFDKAAHNRERRAE